jgi:PAS domain S-box-containing protein
MALTGPDGAKYILGISEDITEQKKNEDAVRQLNAELEIKVAERTKELSMVAETIPHLVWIISGQGKGLYFNNRWLEYTGTSREAALSWEDIIHLDDISVTKAAWEASMRTGEAYNVEYRIKRSSDQMYRWHLTRALPILDSSGNVVKWFGTCTDIHDQKEVMRVARDNAARTDAIISNANIILWSTDTNGICTYSEGNGLALVGTKPGERVGQSIYEYVKNQPEFFDAYRAALNGVKGQARINAGEHSFEAMITPTKNELGQVVGVVGATFDTTERVRAEQELRETKTRLETVFTHAPIVLWSVDRAGKYTLVQGKGLDSAGLKSEDMIGKSIFDLYKDRPEVISGLQSSFEGESFEVESVLNGASYSTQFAPIKNAENQITGVVGLSIDITESKISKEKLQLEKDRLQRVVSASVAGVVFGDSNGRIVDANDTFFEMTGYSRGDLGSGNITNAALGLLLKNYGNDSPVESELVKRDGTRIPVLLGVADLGDGQGSTVSWVMDLSKQKQAERERSELVVNEKAAKEASKLKSEFLANMSHEIRTPINGVMGMTGLLLETELSDEQRDFAENVKGSADSLLTIINDILDFSKVEAGKLNIENIDFDLERTLLETVSSLNLSAKKKGLQLHFQYDGPANCSLRGDPGRLRQIITNLLSNSIKFTQNGKVILRVSQLGDGSIQRKLRFEVEDSGIGISKDVLVGMFQPFHQADASTARKFGGTGLGLSISKRLVELMNGSIGVTSVEDQGSTFWLELPLVMGSLALEKIHPSKNWISVPSLKGARVLVAEDNIVNQKIALKLLEKLGCQADAVANGHEVLSALRSIPYDVVLMDCQMPELDGYDASRQIRKATTEPFCAIPIIAMTANALKGDKDRCIESGMNDYVSKPVKFDEFAQMLQNWLPNSEKLKKAS